MLQERPVNQSEKTALAAFLLRVSLGIMYLAHGLILKVLTFGLPGTAGFFVSIGLPAWLAYVTIAAEVIGGILLVLGLHTRVVALALIADLLGAIIWVHAGNGWVFNMYMLQTGSTWLGRIENCKITVDWSGLADFSRPTLEFVGKGEVPYPQWKWLTLRRRSVELRNIKPHFDLDLTMVTDGGLKELKGLSIFRRE